MSFLKILVIGDVSTGKTSLVNRIVYDNFSPKYKATVGCEFALKLLEIDNQTIRIQLWDLAGQDRLGGMNRLFCRDAHGALVVSDISNPETIEKAKLWRDKVNENVAQVNGDYIPMLLCVNKYDLVEPAETMSPADLSAQSISEGYFEGIYTSGKTAHNTSQVLERLVREVLRRNPPQKDMLEEAVKSKAGMTLERNAKASAEKKSKKGKCC